MIMWSKNWFLSLERKPEELGYCGQGKAILIQVQARLLPATRVATGECGQENFSVKAESHWDKAGMDSGPVGPRPYIIGGGSSLKIQNANYKYKWGGSLGQGICKWGMTLKLQFY